VPILPVERPIPPTPEEKRKGKLPDENMWVWELRDKLTELMDRAIKPLYTYLEVYDKYEDVMNLKPEDYIKELEDEEAEPWTVE